MGMTVVATFMNLPEAQIAAGALASGGLHPLVMDQGWGSVVWTEQAALQGFRLAVPSGEAADAVAFFKALPPAPRPLQTPRRSAVAIVGSNWWRVLGGLLAIGLMPTLGWLVVGLRPKRYRRHGSVMLAVIAVVVIAGALLFTVAEFRAGIPLSVWVVSPLIVAIVALVVTGGRQTPPEA